jgi:preprotein translocase SecE subunit
MIGDNANALAGARSPAAPEDAEETMDATGNDQATDAASQSDNGSDNGSDVEAEEVSGYEAEDLRLPVGAIATRPATQEVRGGSTVEWLLANPFTRFFTESGIELVRKVTWPQPRDAWNMTLVVIAMSVAVALLLGVVDLGLNTGLTWTLSHLSNVGPTVPTATPTP